MSSSDLTIGHRPRVIEGSFQLRIRSGLWLGILVNALLVAVGCGAPAAKDFPSSQPPPSSVAAPAPADGAGHQLPDSEPAATAVAKLTVKGRAPMTGYDRARFGPAWLDADRNGCDTRNDVLAASLDNIGFKEGTRDCVVLSGTLRDPFTGRLIDFVYGDTRLVDVDHLVSLGNAWATGAVHWDVTKRAALANDPLNLMAVDASSNRQKGDSDASTWLPPNKPFRCAYVARQIAVKQKYDLWATTPEVNAFARILDSCPVQRLPADSGAPTSVDHNIADPGSPGSGMQPGGGRLFASCDEARAANATPVRRGDSRYGEHLDGDGDGVACE